ncbi:exonuclease subunit SbcD [uncultured Treponema sp.]|uniref:exonuclease subunit SbcD n=1 Tax=uncultured Treponema sp. TaxID=162155 RepID=UPI0025FFE3F6|nr:exonuclease subunit SbcD [uncultured Treponema sp.]
MRFIHTADWHLGNQMHDIDRKEEVKAFFGFLKSLIIKKNATALIVSGDIFDTANPPLEARRLYYTFLASLSDTCCKNVIIVGGNHDSSVMLDCAKELLDVLNIRVVGSINNLNPSDMCFELKDCNDEVSGVCMALPFIRELELRNLVWKSGEEKSAENRKIADSDLYNIAYQKIYTQVFNEAEKLRDGRNIPIVATGHLYAANLEGRLSEKKSNEKSDDGVKVLDVLGTLGNVPVSVFPPADYVALGHIHYSTMVAKNPAIRYSGSPFVMGFDEAEIPHYVLCVDLNPCAGEKCSLEVEKIETPRIVTYKRLSGTPAKIKEELEALSREKNGTKPLYLELCYKREIGVNVQEYLAETIQNLGENISVVSWKVLDFEKAFSSSSFSGFEMREIKNLDDKEVFTQLILSKSGLEAESEEGKRAIEKFLPLFMQIAAGEN